MYITTITILLLLGGIVVALTNLFVKNSTKVKEIHMEENNNNNGTNIQHESKTAVGVLLGLFLGLIGLVIGLLLYKENTTERSTFIKGWLWAFLIAVIAGVVIGIIVYVTTLNSLNGILNNSRNIYGLIKSM